MSSQKRILCVEDDRSTYELIALLLSNYEVIMASNKADALRLASIESFDLYILDYHLPDGFGTEVCGYIRASDQKTPIIFSTSDDLLTKTHLNTIGAQHLVRKGMSFNKDLEAAVSDLLGRAA
jgi:two-component system, OmpR family, response regulator ArlR